MMTTDAMIKPAGPTRSLHAEATISVQHLLKRPLISVIIRAFNEAAMLWSTLTEVIGYLESRQDRYRWELIVVNDGSSDRTGELAEEFASSRSDVRVAHHVRNLGLGQALKTGFECSRGDYV